MAEQATTIPPKGLGTIKLSDFWKSLLLAALSNILLSLYTIINSGALPTHADLITMLKTTSAIILSYLLKNLGTNNVGQLLTKDKPVVTVAKAVVPDYSAPKDLSLNK
jgi:hypothetical protein